MSPSSDNPHFWQCRVIWCYRYMPSQAIDGQVALRSSYYRGMEDLLYNENYTITCF